MRVPVTLVVSRFVVSREVLGITVMARERVGSVNLLASIRIVSSLGATAAVSTFSRIGSTGGGFGTVGSSGLGGKRVGAARVQLIPSAV